MAEIIDYSQFSTEELIEEIRREESLLKGFRDLLSEAEERREETERAIEEEGLIDKEERYRRRQKRIEELTRIIGEYDGQIGEWEEKVRSREETIRSLTKSIETFEARSRDLRYSSYDRFVYRESAARLRRTLRTHRGYLTRETETLETLRDLRAWMVRRRAGLQRWQTVEAPYIERLEELRADLAKWLAEIARLQKAIPEIEAELEKKYEELRKRKKLSRISINLYLIVEEGEHYYPRVESRHYEYHRPKHRSVRIRRKYPKGAFNSLLHCDAFVNPETRQILQNEEPFPTLLDLMRKDVSREFEEEFSLPHIDPDTLTLGECSEIPDVSEIGKPPFKVRVERTVEGRPEETWSTTVNAYLFSDARYEELTRNMEQYRKHLEME